MPYVIAVGSEISFMVHPSPSSLAIASWTCFATLESISSLNASLTMPSFMPLTDFVRNEL